jgi:hypothetical protein
LIFGTHGFDTAGAGFRVHKLNVYAKSIRATLRRAFKHIADI